MSTYIKKPRRACTVLARVVPVADEAGVHDRAASPDPCAIRLTVCGRLIVASAAAVEHTVPVCNARAV